MEIVENTPERIVAVMAANETLANALRRSINEIPSLAIDEVEIFKNDSAIYDEMLAQRLGLVVLKTEKNMSSKTESELKLTKKGPGLVYSGDLIGAGKVVYDKVPLTLLEDGQEIQLVATAKLGVGLEHEKYSPGTAYYRHLFKVDSSPKIDEIISRVRGVAKPKKKGNSWICDLDDASVNEIENEKKGSVMTSDEIVFVIESWGGMDAKDILKNSTEALGKNLDKFESSL